ENDFNLSKRAEPLIDAVTRRTVVAFAPDALTYEIMKRLAGKISARAGWKRKEIDDVESQKESFLMLPITFVPAKELAARAWELMCKENLSPPDSWYVACAEQHHAELWVSHDHADGLVENARRILPGRVFMLTERKFA